MLALPIITVPKSTDAGDTANVAGVVDWPAPLKSMFADGFAALLAMLMEPLAAPEEEGENVTVSVVDAPPARLRGKVAPLTLYPVPVAVAELTLIAIEGELLDKVNVNDFEDPVATVPKFKLLDEKLSDAGA